MQGIPPVKDTDAEDVAWGLQTAEALWKRGERGDAIVWLRRAAQAAGDASDDDRALELARFAAELTDWINATAPGTLVVPGATQPPSVPGATSQAPAQAPSPSGSAPVPPPPADLFPPPVPADIFPPPVPAILQGTSNAPPAAPKVSKPPPVPKALSKPPVPSSPSFPPPEEARPKPPPASSPAPRPPEDSRPEPPPAPPPSQPTMQMAEPAFRDEQAAIEPEPRSASVPPADRVHAGMFNPWEEGSGVPSEPKVPAPQAAAVAGFAPEEDEVITSANLATLRQSAHPAATSARPEPPRAHSPSEPPMRAAPPVVPAPSPSSPKVAPKPPPLPPRARAASISPEAAPAAAAEVAAAPAVEAAAAEAPPRVTPPPPSPTQVTAPADRVTRVDRGELSAPEETPAAPAAPAAAAAAAVEDARAVEGPAVAIPGRPSDAPRDDAPAPAAEPPKDAAPALDLDGVDAFSDLPDDARAAFAAAAKVSKLAEADEVSHFALAYVLDGALDVAATMVDAPASRLAKGAVLRARGTTDEGVPMRLICVGAAAVVATWTDDAVDEAFRTCPWVEDDLRAAADKMLTLVGITIGPLGERLDASIREQIVGRLQMRPLAPGEIVVSKGGAVPLLLVGVGDIELVDGDTVKGTVGSGEFLFAGEVLGAGAAPLTARAGAGGALVLQGERQVAQELLVTCPPLLEVFAGM